MNAFVAWVIRGSLFNDFVYDEKLRQPYCSESIYRAALQDDFLMA